MKQPTTQFLVTTYQKVSVPEKEYFKLEGQPEPLSDAAAKYLDENLKYNDAFFSAWDSFCDRIDRLAIEKGLIKSGKVAQLPTSQSQAA